MSLLNPASTDRADTPTNEQGNGASARQFRPEIGLAADSLAGSTGSFPPKLIAAAQLSEPSGGGSFGKRRRNRGGQPLLVGRPCEQCGEILTRKDGEARGQFNVRRFCGNSCAVSARSAEREPPKLCLICHKPYERRAHGETPTRFAARKYCSNVCARKWGGLIDHAERIQKFSGFNTQGFPKPRDRDREADLYAAAGRYDAPGRTVVLETSTTHRLDARPPTHVFAQSSLGAISR